MYDVKTLNLNNVFNGVNYNMNKKHLLLFALMCSPVFAFASSGDTTFLDIVTEVKGYLGGSLGLLLVLVGFLGAGFAMAGMGSMKLMFPILGLTLAMHYGPGILEKIFSATGDYQLAYLHHTMTFSSADLCILMVSAAMFVLAGDLSKLLKVGVLI